MSASKAPMGGHIFVTTHVYANQPPKFLYFSNFELARDYILTCLKTWDPERFSWWSDSNIPKGINHMEDLLDYVNNKWSEEDRLQQTVNIQGGGFVQVRCKRSPVLSSLPE